MTLGFVPGKKNRHVIVRTPASVWLQLSSDGEVQSNMTLGGENGESWIILRVATSPMTQTWTGSAKVGRPIEPSTEMRFRKGESALVAGDRVEIGATIPYSPMPGDGPFDSWRLGGGKAWRVQVDHQIAAPLSGGLQFTPLDREGRAIEYVDG